MEEANWKGNLIVIAVKHLDRVDYIDFPVIPATDDILWMEGTDLEDGQYKVVTHEYDCKSDGRGATVNITLHLDIKRQKGMR